MRLSSIAGKTCWTVAALAVAVLLVSMSGEAVSTARASVPGASPTFTNPTLFTNTFFPFAPGAMKVFVGKSDGEATQVLDLYRPTTRMVSWGGQTVECRLLEEVEFENGELVEISYNFFAQADDGSVYYFGELVDNYEDGAILDHEGAWLVGGPAAGEVAATAADPALFMPANPEVGDIWNPENIPALGIMETDELKKVGVKVKVPAGKMDGCLEVRELDLDGEKETKWYAPGVGVIKAKADGEKLKLAAMTPHFGS
jgi:hypothetical protein